MTGWVMTNHPVILILGMRRSYTLYAKTAFYAVRRMFYSVIEEKEPKLIHGSADKIQPA